MTQGPCRTTGCRRRQTASARASLPLSAAPEPQRYASRQTEDKITQPPSCPTAILAGSRKEPTMAERLALCILPGTRWSAQEIQTIAREAEEAGFDAIFTNEFGNDALATAQLMGAATHRILVGTFIANIYPRHPYVCAQAPALIADATEGRFVLGLGVSHPGVNEALGIDMQHPPTALRRYVTAVQSWLRGESPLTDLPQRAAAQPVPVY